MVLLPILPTPSLLPPTALMVSGRRLHRLIRQPHLIFLHTFLRFSHRFSRLFSHRSSPRFSPRFFHRSSPRFSHHISHHVSPLHAEVAPHHHQMEREPSLAVTCRAVGEGVATTQPQQHVVVRPATTLAERQGLFPLDVQQPILVRCVYSQ